MTLKLELVGSIEVRESRVRKQVFASEVCMLESGRTLLVVGLVVLGHVPENAQHG